MCEARADSTLDWKIEKRPRDLAVMRAFLLRR
jgi:hypothetical protein